MLVAALSCCGGLAVAALALAGHFAEAVEPPETAAGFASLKPGMSLEYIEAIYGAASFQSFEPGVSYGGSTQAFPPSKTHLKTTYCLGNTPVELAYSQEHLLLDWRIGSGMCFSSFQVWS